MLNVVFILLLSLAHSYPQKLKVFENANYTSVAISTQDKLHLNDKCSKLIPRKCEALIAASKKSTASTPKTDLTGHPASRYCHDKNGVARILISDDNKQYDFCLFSDGSMIDSWDLYYKHYPRE